MADSTLKIAVILSAVDKMTAIARAASMKSSKALTDFANKANKISKEAFDVGKSAGAIGLAIAAPIGYTIKAASDLQETLSKTNAVFKDGSKDVIEWSKNSAKGFGQSQQAALEAASTYGNLFQAFGLGQGKAQDMSMTLTKLASDLASFNNTSVEEAINSIRSGMTGETEPLKKYGVILSDVRLKQAAFAMGLIKSTKDAMTPSTKSLASYNLIMKDTKMSQGDFARTSDQLANKQRILQAQFQNVSTKVGTTLIPLMTNLLNKISPVIDKIVNWINKNPKLTQQIAIIAAGAAALALATSALAFTIGGLAKAFQYSASTAKFLLSLTRQQTYTDAIATVKKTALSIATYGYAIAMNVASAAMRAFGTVVRVVTAIMNTNPILLIITAIAASALLIYKYWEPIKKFFINLWDGIKNIFNKVVAWVKEYGILFIAPVGIIIKYWDKIKAFFVILWEGVRGKFVSFIDFVLAIPKRMFNAGANIVKSIWEGMKSFINKPIEAIKNMALKIREYLPFSPAKVGPLRDIHKIRLVETIAESIKPNSLTRAMRATTASAMIAVSPMMGKSAGNINSSGGGASVHYAPTIHINGGSPTAKEDFKKLLKDHEKDITRLIEEANRKSNRTKL